MRVGIVGGGISGLLSALALEKEGYEVVLFEKDKIGGLCRSEKIDGYQVDIGVHAITMLNNGPLIRLLKKYSNYLPNFRSYGDYYIRLNNGLHKIPVSLQEWLTTPIVPHKDKIIITTKTIDLMSMGFEKDTSVYCAVKGLGLSEISLKFFDTISYFLSGEDMRNTPLWRLFTGAGYIPEDDILPFIYEDSKINPMKSILIKKINPERVRNILSKGFLKTIKDGSKSYISKFISGERYSTQGYPLGGIQSITNCILNSLKNTRIKYEEVISIEKDEKENSYIIGTNEDSYNVDIVVFSAPSRILPDIAKNIDEIKKLENYLKNIKYTTSLTVWFGIDEDKNPLKYKGSEIWIDPPAWAKCITNYDKSLAPEGKALIGVSFVNKTEKEAYEAIEKYLNIDVEKTDFLHVQRAIPEQASCCIGQFFVYPKVSDTFYIVGTDADPRSMGITRAAYSVDVMLSEILNKKSL
ncbi:NAD(P)-binding protein [Methanocaldococcus fervens]|nr:NAD(P)-binding protein [Methanocaldococcus fervens]